ncbi:hypothetical protein D7D52_16980 [Nocardia yunnanensis]|uniref:Cysteine dioxygenase n=1 Tax=Nocardia yunnanensis TaxID=2382165 RepID=A0A386ZDT9_9NOCA|nr:hypothetical protein [Nocardia yunnanensis]AYF75284.1 hypothetical protein D7D52_16980 [Nocardia yunnanensis]
MTDYPHPDFAVLAEIDWDDTESILTHATVVFDALTREGNALVLDLLERLPAQPALTGMCEGYDFMRKLVLWTDPDSDVRLRLHLYSGRHTERPHNHRWPFSSRIVRGNYQHNLYGSDTGFDENTDPAALKPLLAQRQRPGDTFALHHASVHNVCADPGTVSMILRGPAAKTRFLIHDTATRAQFHVYGAAQETAATRATKQLDAASLATAVGDARNLLLAHSPVKDAAHD